MPVSGHLHCVYIYVAAQCVFYISVPSLVISGCIQFCVCSVAMWARQVLVIISNDQYRQQLMVLFSFVQYRQLMVQLFQAVEFLHSRNIVHRDIKVASSAWRRLIRRCFLQISFKYESYSYELYRFSLLIISPTYVFDLHAFSRRIFYWPAT